MHELPPYFRETSGVDVKSFMKEWTEVKGYPLLKVNRINDTHVKIEQEPFLQDQGEKEQTQRESFLHLHNMSICVMANIIQ